MLPAPGHWLGTRAGQVSLGRVVVATRARPRVHKKPIGRADSSDEPWRQSERVIVRCRPKREQLDHAAITHRDRHRRLLIFEEAVRGQLRHDEPPWPCIAEFAAVGSWPRRLPDPMSLAICLCRWRWAWSRPCYGPRPPHQDYGPLSAGNGEHGAHRTYADAPAPPCRTHLRFRLRGRRRGSRRRGAPGRRAGRSRGGRAWRGSSLRARVPYG